MQVEEHSLAEYSRGNKCKTPHKFCYNLSIRRSQKDKISTIVGNDIIKIMENVFITTIKTFCIIQHFIFLGVEKNKRPIARNPFSTTISKFLKMTIKLNRWQFLVIISHHQTVDKRTPKIPKDSRKKEELKFQFIVKKNTVLVL